MPLHTPTMTLAKLHKLLNLITSAVLQLEEACVKTGTSIPDLDAPFDPLSEAFREDPTADEAANIIGAAALHMWAIITPPHFSVQECSSGAITKSAALRVCLESNVSEILREAGHQRLHINDITAQNGQDPSKLGRCLRYLATHHVFKEVSPNVFSNNRVSSLLDTGKSVQELFAYPDKKHDNTSGFPAFLSFHLDEGFKALANVWEISSDPSTVKSCDPSQSAFTKFVGGGKTLWEYSQEHDFQNRRFNMGMQGSLKLQHPDAVLFVYDWKRVPAGSVVVDVGGGIGTSQLCLAREFPHLKIIIQDLPHVVEGGIKVWKNEDPGSLEAGRVTFEAHDFFEPQPQRDVSFFFLKQVLHDWSDERCFKMLTQLRKAASPTTKLLSMNTIIEHACHDQNSFIYTIPGASPHEAPSPLLANWGAVNAEGYRHDIVMLALFNAKERSLEECISLFEQSGWKLVEVHRQKGARGSYLACLEATPI